MQCLAPRSSPTTAVSQGVKRPGIPGISWDHWMTREETGNRQEFCKKNENPGISIPLYYFWKGKIVKSIFFFKEKTTLPFFKIFSNLH